MLLNDDFLLTTEWAKKLFHNHAERMPIIDYHCHLSPKEIWENEKFGNLAEIWICKDGAGDHYKWRLMRAAGVPEELISGNGDDYEKFLSCAASSASTTSFARRMPRAFGIARTSASLRTISVHARSSRTPA